MSFAAQPLLICELDGPTRLKVSIAFVTYTRHFAAFNLNGVFPISLKVHQG
jgi:hypothetical protein